MADIGIDLGTTNSVLAFLRGGPEVISIKGKSTLPSVVAYDDGQFIVGSAAKSLAAAIDDVVVSPKRGMGTDQQYSVAGKTYTPVDISAMILEEIKKHAEEYLGEPVQNAIITIPAHFNHKQVEDTREAAERAGLKVGQLLAEPVAAAAAYGSGSDEVILVFDMGGGTLDCTVIDMFDNQILGLSGDNWLGGDDFDQRIVDRMLKEMEAEGVDISEIANDKKFRIKLKQKAEIYKINLSDTSRAQVEYVGKVAGAACYIDFSLTRNEYNELISDLVDRALEKADEAVERAELKKSDIDVILLVGGSTLTPYVQERLEAHFGKPASKRVDPMLAVGLGAAICTRDLAVGAAEHAVRLRSRAEIWSDSTYPLRGRTTGDSKIEVTGGAEPVDGAADESGQFSVDVPLKENAVNDLTVVAVSPAGETAKAVYRIRHDIQAEQAEEPEEIPPPKPTLPRNILLGLIDHHIAKIIGAGSNLPTCGESDQFFCEPNPYPFKLQIPVYEGHDPNHEIPFGPFNTALGTMYIDCPPTPQQTQLVLSFEVNESRDITIRCWF
ncbi:MAG: Hsp70 family protein, partial [Planctomycetes bacterium]|nr:Hsp70 family protein [Planctomycetota bacterium]